MKRPFFGLLIAVFLVGCSNDLSKEAFVDWCQTIKPVEIQTKDHKITVRYFPPELLMMNKKNISSEEISRHSNNLWITIDIDKKRYFPSVNSNHDEHGTSFAKEQKQELSLIYQNAKPIYEVNEFQTGKDLVGRWIVGWKEKADITKELLINLDDTAIIISCSSILPQNRPSLKI